MSFMPVSGKNLIGMLVVFVLSLATLSAWATIQPRLSDEAPTAESSVISPLHLQTTESGEIIPPQMTETMKKVLEESKGFQALVSYTERGFEPHTLSVKRGETVRFINNSAQIQDLWVASHGSPYPSSHDSCGQSAFDSCISLRPLEFWEFTFTETGEWKYVNNLHKDFSGVIRVK